MEGEPVILTPSAFTLGSQTFSSSVSFVPPTGESTLVLDPPAGFTFSPLVSRVSLKRTPIVPVALSSSFGGAAPAAANQALTPLDFVALSNATGILKVTSLNKDLLLLSTSLDGPGTESVNLPAGNLRVYLHGQRAGGVAGLRVESPGMLPFETRVSLYPLSAYVSSMTDLLEGQSGTYRIYLTAGPRLLEARLPKGSTPLRFPVRSGNPGVVSVSAPVVEIREGQYDASVMLTGVAAGATEVVTDPVADIDVTPSRIPISVRRPRISSSTLLNNQVFIGRNLQTEV